MNTKDENAKLWKYVESSPFAGIYLTEMYWLAKDVEQMTDKLFEDTSDVSEGTIKVDHSIISSIFLILTQSARLRTFINLRPRYYYKSSTKYEFHRARVNWLKNILSNTSTTEIEKSKVRNTIEHSDEYFDETALKSYKAQIRRPSLLPIDMIVGDDKVFDQFSEKNGEVYLLRVYNALSKEFINCGYTINLLSLNGECKNIIHILANYLDKSIIDPNRVSTIVVVTDRSFDL